MYGTVRTVVWEDGGGNPASYPIVANQDHNLDRGDPHTPDNQIP